MTQPFTMSSSVKATPSGPHVMAVLTARLGKKCSRLTSWKKVHGDQKSRGESHLSTSTWKIDLKSCVLVGFRTDRMAKGEWKQTLRNRISEMVHKIFQNFPWHRFDPVWPGLVKFAICMWISELMNVFSQSPLQRTYWANKWSRIFCLKWIGVRLLGAWVLGQCICMLYDFRYLFVNHMTWFCTVYPKWVFDDLDGPLIYKKGHVQVRYHPCCV